MNVFRGRKTTSEIIICTLGAYLVSGIFAIPLILKPKMFSGILYNILVGGAIFGPFISSIITTYLFEKKEGIIKLFKSVFLWKRPVYLYFFILTLPAILMFLSGSINNIVFGGAAVTIMFPDAFKTAIFSPLGEELAWRGVVTPRLQKKYSPFLTSLILGIVWAGWHYWLFMISNNFEIKLPFILFGLGCVSETLLYTWFYNKSKGSVLSTILFHSVYNLTYHIIPIRPEYFNGSIYPYVIFILLELILGLFLNLKCNSKTFKDKWISMDSLSKDEGGI